MKKIGFIGAYDKTDLLLNIAKVLTVMNYRVLVVDSTINQKARYVVPAIDPTVSYITSFEDMDVAVGFNNVLEIQRYIGTTGELPYDILLIDCDTIERVEQFELEKADKNYFVTSFDVYSLKRGLEILSNITVPIKLTKTIFTKEVLKEENGDSVVITENQRLQKIKLKKISLQYKESISFIIQQVLNQNNDSNIRKAIKAIEKGA